MTTTKEKITYYTPEDEQLETMVNGQSDEIYKRREAAYRSLSRPIIVMWVLVVLTYLANLLAALEVLSPILCGGIQGACLLALLISVVTLMRRLREG